MGYGQQSPGGDHQQQGPWPPYAGQPPAPGGRAPWNAPTEPTGQPTAASAPWSVRPGPPPSRGGRRSSVVAVVAATAVVLAAGITGFLMLGGDGDDGKPDAGSTGADVVSPSASPGEPRGGAKDGTAPLVPGWKTVINPKRGVAFDVPEDWALKSSGWVTYVAENSDPAETPLVGFSAPAILKEKWCRSDDDGNGTQEDTPLASAGSRGEPAARSTAEAARENARLWVYGTYAQPSKEKVTTGAAKPFITKSGITGRVATATSTGVDGTSGPLRLRRQGDRVRLREPGG